jgi:hypothetical protein
MDQTESFIHLRGLSLKAKERGEKRKLFVQRKRKRKIEETVFSMITR